MMRAKTAVDIHELFAQRRSPRTFDEKANMSHEDGNANPTFMYDCGLAVAQLTLEAHHRGFVAHQMAGIDAEKAAELFEGQKPVVIVAIGKQAPADQLEGPAYDRENAVRERKDLSEIVLRGLPL